MNITVNSSWFKKTFKTIESLEPKSDVVRPIRFELSDGLLSIKYNSGNTYFESKCQIECKENYAINARPAKIAEILPSTGAMELSITQDGVLVQTEMSTVMMSPSVADVLEADIPEDGYDIVNTGEIESGIRAMTMSRPLETLYKTSKMITIVNGRAIIKHGTVWIAEDCKLPDIMLTMPVVQAIASFLTNCSDTVAVSKNEGLVVIVDKESLLAVSRQIPGAEDDFDDITDNKIDLCVPDIVPKYSRFYKAVGKTDITFGYASNMAVFKATVENNNVLVRAGGGEVAHQCVIRAEIMSLILSYFMDNFTIAKRDDVLKITKGSLTMMVSCKA